MDWWLFFKIIRIVSALAMTGATFVILWRIRGILSWKRSLKDELKALKISARDASPSGQAAIRIIEKRCEAVFHSFSPEFAELRDIPDFIISIAACHHPDAPRPELQITLGALFRNLENSLERFDSILARPGFKRLAAVNIRHIRDSRKWYLRITGSRFYIRYARYKKRIRQIFRFRFVLLPDPFSLLTYLSGQFTILMLTKYLMADIYLFLGKLAADSYAEKEILPEDGKEALEDTLETLETLKEEPPAFTDPQLQDIRRRLAGLSAVVIAPGLAEWKTAMYDAALIISKKHFPESDAPLQEAAVGPLLERTRAWTGMFVKGEDFPLLRHLYRMRLETLFTAKNLSAAVLPKRARDIIMKALKTYGWLRWPLKVYQLAGNFSPWKIALEAGWMAAKKTSIAYSYGKAFDKACKEADTVYARSRELKERKTT